MNPYLLEGPANIAFSGGRTSAFMLRKILDAHGGELPDDVNVSFCNTGLEHPATYDFIHEVEKRWCRVVWLEYLVREDDSVTFKVVDYETSARKGEPFTALIKRENTLPNPVARICTARLKIRTTIKFCKSLGWEEWDNAVGLRFDEPWRVARLKGDIKAENPVTPMHDAKHIIDDVLTFWSEQDFDLNLPWKEVGVGNFFGNCVGCFLKSRRKIEDLMREEPEHFDWWVAAEKIVTNKTEQRANRFRKDWPTYEHILEGSRRQGRLFQGPRDDHGPDLSPCMCTD